MVELGSLGVEPANMSVDVLDRSFLPGRVCVRVVDLQEPVDPPQRLAHLQMVAEFAAVVRRD